MTDFLRGLARELLHTHGTDLGRVAVVLPTQRAGLFLRREIGRQLQADGASPGQPVWLPQMLTWEGLLEQLAARRVPDRLTLVLLLYERYRTLIPEEGLERFLAWGEVILADFDELDRNGVDARQLFSNLQDIKELEASMPFTAAELESFRQFWATFSTAELGELQRQFLRLWESLGPLYQQFRSALNERHWAYPGMLVRQVRDALAAGEALALPASHLVFAGLHGLGRAETDIVASLVKRYRAEVRYDADAWYVTDVARHEAGRWLAQQLGTPAKRNLPRQIGAQPLRIDVLGVPLNVTQGRIVSDWVRQALATGSDPTRVAVVLPDEALLFPVLYALPPDLPALNVTMGYPMRAAPVYALLHYLVQLNTRARYTDDRIVAYYHRDVKHVLLHAYVQYAASDRVRQFVQRMEENAWVYVLAASLPHRSGEGAESDAPLLELLFRPLRRADDALAAFLQLLAFLRERLVQPDADAAAPAATIELEILFHFQAELQRLRDVLGAAAHDLPLPVLWRLLSQVFQSGRIPFSGEPLAGIQVMGLRETRALDFDHVLVLSMNEGTLPQGRNQTSLIPYNLRKGFGLPTYEDADGAQAYLFYRLLHRAHTATLCYNVSPNRGSGGAGEKSRLLLQVEYELAQRFSGTVQLRQAVLSLPAAARQPPPVRIDKDERVRARLEPFTTATDGATGALKPLSPTDLQHYVTCPLRFYLAKVADLASPDDEPVEEMDARALGSVLHEALHRMYQPHVGRLLQPADVAALEARANETLEAAALHVLPDLRYGLQGRNLLRMQVLRRLLRHVLQLDAEYAPFTIHALEQPLERMFCLPDGRNVRLRGFADRIDEKDGTYRLVDYKTGAVKRPSKPDLTKAFTDHKLKETFQALLYAWMFDAEGTHLAAGQLKVALYALKTLHNGVVDILADLPPMHAWQEFETQLAVLLQRILDAETPFEQRVYDNSICTNCDFHRICWRT